MKGHTMILKDFKTFLMQRNVLELTTAIVLGNAFILVMTSLIHDIITPLCRAAIGEHTLEKYSLVLGKNIVQYGIFLQTVVHFLFVAFIFYMVFRMRPFGQTLGNKVIDPLDETFIDPLERKIRGKPRDHRYL